LAKLFFDQLRILSPKYNVESGSGSPGEQTAKIIIGVEKVLQQEKPDIVLVEGDTNSVLASTLAATKLHIKVGHVEAGLRSCDRNMPEEINRIITDHCADLLFAPTNKSKNILKNEGIPETKIFLTGNTIVDAVRENLEISQKTTNIADDMGIKPKEYFLVTIHRQENIDARNRFTSILKGLEQIASEFNIPVIYPIHPHSKKMMTKFKLESQQITLIEPIDFLSFLQLEKNARLILTDSGGVQEESCILGVPCVTLRDNTERPETIEVGANILAGTSPEKMLGCLKIMLARKADWINPFGDGTAGKKIVEIVTGHKYA
jgi:UDP-N-acetylglucosamine 2-epimerase (non-hydrolysing)